MNEVIPEFEPFKGQIPQFIFKLYHILEKNDYNDYLAWNGDDEVLIKSGKKLEDKVLPHFFRHKHISSFIRQLNMYKFSKVTKLAKEKNHMYFKNEFFKRGCVEQLVKIKRNHKKKGSTSKNDLEHDIQSESNRIKEEFYEDEISIENGLSDNTEMLNYKEEVRRSMQQMRALLGNVMQKFPETTAEMKSAQKICMEVLNEEKSSFFPNKEQIEDDANEFEKNQNGNMLTSVKDIPKMESCFFSSQFSFKQFD